jgi:hypothetical protein
MVELIGFLFASVVLSVVVFLLVLALLVAQD